MVNFFAFMTLQSFETGFDALEGQAGLGSAYYFGDGFQREAKSDRVIVV